jgi:hypothetical protein
MTSRIASMRQIWLQRRKTHGACHLIVAIPNREVSNKVLQIALSIVFGTRT